MKNLKKGEYCNTVLPLEYCNTNSIGLRREQKVVERDLIERK